MLKIAKFHCRHNASELLAMKTPPEIIGTRAVCDSRLFKVDAVTLRFSNGVQTDYERIGGITDGNAVMIVPVTDDGRLLFISEYSVGTERYETVFPKGKIDPGETGQQAALRELREETGFRAEQLTLLRSVSVVPGYASFVTEIWLATGLTHAPLPGDEPEPLDPVVMSIDEALGIEEGPAGTAAITEARTLLAVYLVKQRFNNPAPG